MKIPIYKVKKIIEDYGGIERKQIDEFKVYKKDNVIIKIPIKGTIDYEHFEFIAMEQLDLSPWEFDYFIGQNGIA